jgi:hypothetical protein
MEAQMDYTVLTAVHPRTIAPTKMNSREEQDYYARADASQALQEKVSSIIIRVWRLASALPTLSQSVLGKFSHGLTARKALH